MSVLDKIINVKLREVEQLKARKNSADLKGQASECPPCRDFIKSLRECPHIPVIAEIKKSSPSMGVIKNLDGGVGTTARAYEDGGAAALSVLTDKSFFSGDLTDLVEARSRVGLPVLRKDFIIDPVQLYESRVAGADAVLLITAALEPSSLHDLFHEALELGLTPLIEVHTDDEINRAASLNPPLVGINNRNLNTLEVDLNTCLELLPLISNDALVVSESGIHTAEQIAMLHDAGVDAFLIGTTLMRTDDPRAVLGALCQKRN